MIKNHLKLAFRNLLKRKGYSLLNILGLGIGITCCLLIFQYVAYEKSYESFNKAAGQVMRLRLDSYQKGKLAWQSATSYPAIGPTMKKDFPEVQNFCRLIDANLLLSNPDKNIKFNETKGYYADPSALNMLGVTLIKGNPATALNGPDKILLSETMARKYFGNEEALGKRLIARDGQTQHYEVTGILNDYPANSHLILNHLVSYSTLGKLVTAQGDSSNATETSFGWYDYYTYIQLKPGSDWKTLQSKLPAFCDRYINGQEWNKKNNVKESLFLIPLTDIYLFSNYNQEAEVNGNGKAVGFLFLIAFFIVVIAWVNYTNLATARSLERAREVGVRKVLGAIRRDLIAQFLTESLLMNLLAFLLALGSAFLLTPFFNTLIGSDQTGSFSLPLNYSLGLGLMFLAGAFLSGIYPAFVLSGYPSYCRSERSVQEQRQRSRASKKPDRRPIRHFGHTHRRHDPRVSAGAIHAPAATRRQYQSNPRHRGRKRPAGLYLQKRIPALQNQPPPADRHQQRHGLFQCNGQRNLLDKRDQPRRRVR